MKRAEQERAALEQEERIKIDQNFEQKRTQIETEHQKQKEKQIELLEKNTVSLGIANK